MSMDVNEVRIDDGWRIYQLKNKNGMEVHILNYGAKITKMITMDKYGEFENIVLGYEDIKDYKEDNNFLGSIVGPVAGRLDGAHFEIDGEVYTLEKNEGNNTLHSGSIGLQNVLWEGKIFIYDDSLGVTLEYNSVDGEFGFPGNKTITITYTLTNEDELVVDYQATSDKKTPIILTNHTYFNLTGNPSKTIKDHKVSFTSNKFAELEDDLIPTGNLINVDNTPFDFRKEISLKKGIYSDFEQNVLVGDGYDHYFFFNEENDNSTISVKEESSGRRLTIETDYPGMVMYTSNNLEEDLDLDSGKSKKYSGVCFETQEFPQSVKDSGYHDVYLEAGEKYSKRTKYSMSNL